MASGSTTNFAMQRLEQPILLSAMNKPALSMTRLDNHSTHRVDRDVPRSLSRRERSV